jgi:hypothetical protein
LKTLNYNVLIGGIYLYQVRTNKLTYMLFFFYIVLISHHEKMQKRDVISYCLHI